MKDRKVKVAGHPDLMPSEETAEEIGVTEKSLQRWAREGRGPRRVRIGNRAYYWRPDVQAWLESQFEATA